MSAARILLIEDEHSIADILEDNLCEEGYEVVHAADGREGLEQWRRLEPDLVVLDVMLPQLNGYNICQTMRNSGKRTPVLFLSARGQAEDRVQGLRVGGDDYLVKPFHLPEFLLRVQNMLQRQHWGQARQHADLYVAGYAIDLRSGLAQHDHKEQRLLNERERKLLRLFCERPEEVLRRDDILDAVWGEEAFPSSRTVERMVTRLRHYFETDPNQPHYFHSVWGVGYRFSPAGQAESSPQAATALLSNAARR